MKYFFFLETFEVVLKYFNLNGDFCILEDLSTVWYELF